MEGEVIVESSGLTSSNNALPRENQAKSCSAPSSGRFKGVVPQQNGHWGAQIGEVIGESSGLTSSNNALPRENQAKSCSAPSSGRFKGVVPQQNGHWGAQIYAKHQRIWLGTFKTETEAAMAYDSAAIKIRSGDSYNRNIPWTSISIQEPDFQAQYTTEGVLNMIKDGSYPSKFADFLRNHSQSAEEEGGACVVEGHGDGRLSCKQLFQKELTPSDVGKLNRLVIPKKYAIKYFPPISAASPEENEDRAEDVELVFFDRFMKLWRFRYCYWSSSQSYVFTRGWNRFVREKDLKANETITFMLCEPRGVGVGGDQSHKFCMIDVDRDQINKVPADGNNSQNVVILQLALRSGAQEADRVVEMEGLDLRLALRPSFVEEGMKEEEVEVEVVDKNEKMMNLELQLALRPSVEEDEEGFTLFGVQMKKSQCLRA